MAKVQSSKKRLSQVICADDYMGFIEFLTRTSTNDELLPSTKEMLQTITSHRAIDCLSVLLNRKSPQGFDAAEGGLYPLQIAAQSLWLDGTETIVKHGALTTDVPCHDPTHSPLSYALKAIRDNTYVSEWNPKISIFKLIFIFCLPELNEPLEIVKLLASKSKTEQLEMISLRCVLQGEVAQLTALLLVAWDKLVKPFSDQGIEGSTIGSLILNELRRFQEDSVSQSCNSSSDAGAGEHVVTLENAWKVPTDFGHSS